MNLLEKCRFSFQFITFTLLIVQMTMAFIKYLSNPTVVTTYIKNIENVDAPTILICRLDQYDWTASKYLGYTFRTQFHLGTPDNSSGYLAWGGYQGLMFEDVKKLLYKANFDNVSVTDGFIADRFILPEGFCKEWTYFNYSKELSVAVRDGGVQIFVTDPAKTMHYKVSKMSMHGDVIKLEPNINKR